MNASFTVQGLLGGGALVSGTDIHGKTGQAELSTSQWDSIQSTIARRSNQEQFDQAVAEFFNPLTEAAEALASASKEEPDYLETLVLNPGTPGVKDVPAEVIHLNTDSVILRIIEEGSQKDINRLVWKNEYTLLVLEAPVQVDTGAVAPDEPPF